MLRVWNLILFYVLFASISLVLFAALEWTSLSSWIAPFLFPLLSLYIAYSTSLLCWQQYDLRARLPLSSQVSSSHKAVLVTGCDSGFGLWLALDLLDLGFTVIGCCLSSQSDGANRLRSHRHSSTRLVLVTLDVTSEQSVSDALQMVQTELCARHLHLFALVNNAGIMASCEIEFGCSTLFERQLSVNCLGAVRVTKAFLPLLREASLVRQSLLDHPTPMDSVPRVINMCSLAGRHAIPGKPSLFQSLNGPLIF
jgi:NADP-dependent 3-hydroxy acid dehydrogenase YdfG